MIKEKRGSSILTTPIIVAVGILLVTILVLVTVELLVPYLWYEKLSSATIKYIYVMEEYGYLTSKEASILKEELINQGFEGKNLSLNYTNNKVAYGEPIYLKIDYNYKLKLPFMDEQIINMVVERNSVSKR